jgi:hypothetical protein
LICPARYNGSPNDVTRSSIRALVKSVILSDIKGINASIPGFLQGIN